MNKIIYMFLLVACLTFSSPGKAGTWTQWAPVELLYQYTTGSVFIRLVGQHNDPNIYGCSAKHYFLLDQAKNNFDIVYSALLAAQHNGREMKFELDGCSGTGWPLIKHAQSR